MAPPAARAWLVLSVISAAGALRVPPKSNQTGPSAGDGLHPQYETTFVDYWSDLPDDDGNATNGSREGYRSGSYKIIFMNSEWQSLDLLHHPPPRRALECGAVTCLVSKNASDLRQADAAVWNARWMNPIRAAPDPSSKPRGARWVFNFNFEAQTYMGNTVGIDTTTKLAPSMDWTLTYMASSDFQEHYGRFVKSDTRRAPVVQTASRTKFALALISNCVTHRMDLLKKVNAALPANRKVTVYGSCGERFPCARGDRGCEARVLSAYKFYFALENSKCDGYITEKIHRAFEHGMVPVVNGGRRGRPDYEALFPAGSFVHSDDFATEAGLAARLAELDRDDGALRTYHEWRGQGTMEKEPALCKVCAELHKDPKEQRPRFGKDLVKWFYADTCRKV